MSTVVAMSAVAQLWEDEWEVLLISLQVSGGWGAGQPLPQNLPNKAFSWLFFFHAFSWLTSLQRPRGSRELSGSQSKSEQEGGYSLGFLHPECPPLKNGDRVACPMDRDRLSGCW